MGDFLGSHVLELTNEDLLETGEERVVDEEVTTQNPLRPSTFTIQKFSEVLKGTESALKTFHTDGPNFEYSLKTTSTITKAQAYYREIFYENKKQSSTQITSDSYFKKPLPVKSGEKSPDSWSTNVPTNVPESNLVSLSRSLDFYEPGGPDAVPSP